MTDRYSSRLSHNKADVVRSSNESGFRLHSRADVLSTPHDAPHPYNPTEEEEAEMRPRFVSFQTVQFDQGK